MKYVNHQVSVCKEGSFIVLNSKRWEIRLKHFKTTKQTLHNWCNYLLKNICLRNNFMTNLLFSLPFCVWGCNSVNNTLVLISSSLELWGNWGWSNKHPAVYSAKNETGNKAIKKNQAACKCYNYTKLGGFKIINTLQIKSNVRLK